MAAFAYYDYNATTATNFYITIADTTCASNGVAVGVADLIYVDGIGYQDIDLAYQHANRILESLLRRPLLARRLPWACVAPRCYVARRYDGRQHEKNKQRFYKQKIRA